MRIASRILTGTLALLGLVAAWPLRTLSISLPIPRGTFPAAINERGEIAGYCVDSTAVAHGFMREPSGSATVFDAPRAGPRSRQGTFVLGMNRAGTAVGYYIDIRNVHHGFIREKNGTVVVFGAPGAGIGLAPAVIGHPELRFGQGTLAVSVNDGGMVTGYFIDPHNVRHGFVRDKRGHITTFDVPGSGGTEPTTISDNGEITGYYSDPPRITQGENFYSYQAGGVHGFRRDKNRTITTSEVRGVIALPKPYGSSESGLNQGVQAAFGHYQDAKGINRGFIRAPNGVVTRFEISCEGEATTITSVTPIVVGITRTITIHGRRFGNYRGSVSSGGPYIMIEDETSHWGTGAGPDNPAWTALRVTRWTDTKIVLTGLARECNGPFRLNAGDHLEIGVWNARTRAGPATYDLIVGGQHRRVTSTGSQ